jgi:2-polyprenyl-3-methyl-5-hydroxy-6-metoxy-1,4-benzoquinol methylase
MEWRLFEENTVPHVSTAEFHRDRERAPHLEQTHHRPRMDLALDCVRAAENWYARPTLSDLGAGDGGFLTLVAPFVERAWGYDLCPANVVGAAERGVDVRLQDFTVERPELGTVTTMLEVLEHVARPHDLVRAVRNAGVRVLIASSPVDETEASHDAVHAWAWDMPGYRAMIESGGWNVVRHETAGRYQVVLARR